MVPFSLRVEIMLHIFGLGIAFNVYLLSGWVHVKYYLCFGLDVSSIEPYYNLMFHGRLVT